MSVPILRTSERVAFKRCQQSWQWAWRNGMQPKYPKADALWFGTGIHLALQHRYSLPGLERGHHVLKVWRDYVNDEQAVIYGDNYEQDKQDYIDAGDLGERMLGQYLDEYGMDPTWWVIAAEQSFEIPIPRPHLEIDGQTTTRRTDTPLVTYAGTFDLVARNLETEDSLWLWDHKTARAIQTSHLSLDDQAGSYWAIAADVLSAQGLIKPGDKLDGILYNFLRKAKRDERPVNAEGKALNKPTKAHYLAAMEETGGDGFDIKTMSKMTLARLEELADQYQLIVEGEVSKTQPSPVLAREKVYRTRSERRRQIIKIQNEALHMEAVRSRSLPILKNPTKDCAHMCRFFQLCELHEQGDDWREFGALSFVRSDPYAAHRGGETINAD